MGAVIKPAVLIGLALLVGCAFARPAPISAAAIDWRNCGDGFQCATLDVPVDYSAPAGRTIGLALLRLPAANQGKRIGSLLVNPGGPGASGVDFVRQWAKGLDSSLRERFDIVGFDPRGIGRSAPIVCHDRLRELVAADPSPDNQGEWDALAALSRQFANDCATRADDILPFLGTKNVARDLDRIRLAVGDERLTYLGFSYGTAIGQVYAGMFPGNVRALVLDGVMDLSLDTRAAALAQAAGFERALQGYFADCRTQHCALTRRGDPESALTDLIARVEISPIPSRTADRPAGPGELFLGLIEPLYYRAAWPVLTRAVDAALDGDGSLIVRLADLYLQRNPDGSYPNLIEANAAVTCVDSVPAAVPVTYDAYRADLPRFLAASPHLGPAFAGSVACSSWAARPDPLEPQRALGAPPILVVSTTGDPATPYEWGVAVSQQLASGVLLTYRGDGHTAYLANDDCVDRAVNGYLLSLTVPKAGTVCGNGPEARVPGGPTAVAPSAAGGTPGPPAAGNEALVRSVVIIALVVAGVGGLVLLLRSSRR